MRCPGARWERVPHLQLESPRSWNQHECLAHPHRSDVTALGCQSQGTQTAARLRTAGSRPQSSDAGVQARPDSSGDLRGILEVSGFHLSRTQIGGEGEGVSGGIRMNTLRGGGSYHEALASGYAPPSVVWLLSGDLEPSAKSCLLGS